MKVGDRKEKSNPSIYLFVFIGEFTRRSFVIDQLGNSDHMTQVIKDRQADDTACNITRLQVHLRLEALILLATVPLIMPC